VEFCCGRATPNTAPHKILHRGGANRAAPNENERTPLVWKLAHLLLRYHRRRSLHMNIAVQREPQKRLKPNRRKEISSQFVFVLTEQLSACFSRAMDVLPFCR
jgi:hypothetical protein